MTIEQAKELENGTILAGWNDSEQILKRVSNGYITFGYESSHYIYYLNFLSFEDIVERGFEISENDWDDTLFDSENVVYKEERDSYLPKERSYD